MLAFIACNYYVFTIKVPMLISMILIYLFIYESPRFLVA